MLAGFSHLASLSAILPPDFSSNSCSHKTARKDYFTTLPLRTLHLSGTGVDDEMVAPLQCLPRLTELVLTGTKITDCALRLLPATLTSLTLAVAHVTDQGLLALRLPKLRHLELRSCFVKGNGLRCISAMPELDTLMLINMWSLTEPDALKAIRPGVRVSTVQRDLD